MLIDLKMSMEMEIWKIEKNLCRCCHSEGVYRNLAEPCIKEEQEEIYCDMLQEYLDINITPVSGPLCAVTYTICEDCIHRLKDACSFKQQVTQCELRFRELYIRDIIKIASSYEEIDVKQEVPDEEEKKIDISSLDDEDDDFSFNYDDDEDEDNESETKDLDIKEEQPKKAGPKKPKAKEKTKKNAARPPKLKAGETDKSTEEADKKEDPEYSNEYTVNVDGSKKRYCCNRCSTLLNSYHSMRAHIAAVHLNQFTFNCSLCDEKFKYKESQKVHLANKHGMEQVTIGRRKVLQATKKSACEVCKKEFNSRQLLLRHMVTHRLHKCPECSVGFNRAEISFHRYEAHGVSIPTCGICGYKNPKERLVIAHQRKVHLKEKNYACPECDAKFFDSTHLKYHLVRHNPIKRYQCKYCKKKFPRVNAMRAHEKIHTGDKSKVCAICDERFVQKASLNYHMVKHHPEAI